jgi:hypothetical protein
MDIMLDLETLGTKPGCIVVSVGAVGFDRYTGAILREFYRVIDLADSQRLGLTIDAETVKWWAKQGDEARAVFARDEFMVSSLGDVASDFAEWFAQCGGAACPIWAHGAAFDLPIWEAALAAVDWPTPWAFWMTRDTRTIYDLTGFDPQCVPREGTYHNALDDARHQVRCLHQAIAAGVIQSEAAE